MIHILGAGSLGLLWAARLAEAGLEVRLLLRNEQALQAWQDDDSELVLEQAGQYRKYRVVPELPTAPSAIRTLIVATKAYSVASALKDIEQRLAPDATLLLLQNGMGSQQQTLAHYPQQQVLCASVTDGAWKRSERHVVWAGQGLTQIGDPTGGLCPDWLAAIDSQILAWEWQPQILHTLWLKLAINCAINPFTAVYDCCNGEVPARAGAQLPELINELHRLLAHQGLLLSGTELSQHIHGVIERTAANSSSMRQDIHARRRTEINHISGFALRAAGQARLELPVLQALHRRLETHLAMLGLPTD